MKKKFTTAILISVMTLPLFGCGHKHTYSLVKAAPSNCTYHGTSTDYYKCEGCGKYFDLDKNEIDLTSIELPLGDHTYIHHDKVLPVNGDDGYEEYYTCAYCDLLFDANKKIIDSVPVIPANAQICLINEYNGAEIDILYPRAREFLQTDNPAKFLYNTTYVRSDQTDPVRLSWNFNNATGPFVLEIAKDNEFTNIARSYSFNNKNVTYMDIYNLVPGTYYYRIVGGTYTCPADSFTIMGTLRTINTDNNILNMRDIGGYSTEDGKTVNYEYLYRSATWAVSNPTNVLDIRLKELKMKTELDLRNDSNNTSQHPVASINFVKYGIGQYTQIIPGGKNAYANAYANMGNIFNLFADVNNYPITYHCNAGADRTGTLTFLILGLLGVGYEDICREYELTSIYYDKRWRSDITYADGVYTFTDSGIMQEDSNNYVAFDLLYKTMMNKHGDSSNKLSKAVENYLTSVCGVSLDTISTIRNILLSD